MLSVEEVSESAKYTSTYKEFSLVNWSLTLNMDKDKDTMNTNTQVNIMLDV